MLKIPRATLQKFAPKVVKSWKPNPQTTKRAGYSTISRDMLNDENLTSEQRQQLLEYFYFNDRWVEPIQKRLQTSRETTQELEYKLRDLQKRLASIPGVPRQIDFKLDLEELNSEKEELFKFVRTSIIRNELNIFTFTRNNYKHIVLPEILTEYGFRIENGRWDDGFERGEYSYHFDFHIPEEVPQLSQLLKGISPSESAFLSEFENELKEVINDAKQQKAVEDKQIQYLRDKLITPFIDPNRPLNFSKLQLPTNDPQGMKLEDVKKLRYSTSFAFDSLERDARRHGIDISFTDEGEIISEKRDDDNVYRLRRP